MSFSERDIQAPQKGQQDFKATTERELRACPDLANSAFLSLAVLPCYSEAEVRPHLVTGNLLTVSFFFFSFYPQDTLTFFLCRLKCRERGGGGRDKTVWNSKLIPFSGYSFKPVCILGALWFGGTEF